MLKQPKLFIWILGCMLSVFILSGCVSPSNVEVSRPEYEYVPPVLLRAPTPAPAPVSTQDLQNPLQNPLENSSEDVSDNLSEDEEVKKGFFSRLFSKDNRESKQAATVSRVGDIEEVELNEQGAPLENPQPRDNVYRLKVGDAVSISLSGSGGLNEAIETLIDDEGAIKLRFIGSVKAVGLTSTELEREIEAEYTDRQKIYKDVTVRVVVPNNFYFIGGEIRQPGRFPLLGRVTLSQAIATAGNFTEWANLGDVVLVRNKEKIVINYKQIRQNPNLDVELLSGDTITIGRSFL